MFENTGRNRSVVGGAAALTLALALAVAVGLLPHAGDNGQATQLTAASAAPTVPVATPEAPPATEAPASEAAPVPAPVTTTGSAPVASSPSDDSGPSPESDAAPPPVAAAAGVARVTPSSAQVQAAIAGFHQRIPLFSPSAAQVAQFGDQVCTAFDQGESYSQVKATGLQMVRQYPFVTITSADADWMIHTAVSMYCPGYAGKLS